MPTYEYHCKACDQDFEAFQSITAEPLKECPSCHRKGKVERMISGGAGIIFKGSGFYETDYKTKRGSKSESSGSESSSEKKSGSHSCNGSCGCSH